MKNEFILTLSILLFMGCNSKVDKQPLKKEALTCDTSLVIMDNIADTIINFPVDYSDSINYTDSNGLKQGQWIRKWNGKLIEKYTYVNDTLHGHYETEHEEGYYENGLEEGFKYSYYGEKESLLMVNYYEKGEHLWGGFPAANRDLLIPIKDFHISRDSVYVKAPYINGQTWYEGSFCLLPDSMNDGRLMPYRYGVHKIYHMNGKIKGIVDYSKKTVQEYDSLGNLKYKTKFEHYEVHKLPTLGLSTR